MRRPILLAAVAGFALSSTSLAAQQGQQDIEPIGDVYYVVERDAMTDEELGFVVALDEEQDVRVAWGCFEDEFGAMIELQDPALSMEMITMADGNPEVQYRVDKEEPVGPSSWFSADDEPSTLAARGQEALTFANDVKFGSTLTIRVWNAEGDRVTTKQFPVEGLSRALVKLPCFVQQE